MGDSAGAAGYLCRSLENAHVYVRTSASSCSAGAAVRAASPVTLLTSCLDTYRPDCSADQSAVRKGNNAESISTLSLRHVTCVLYT